MMPTPLSGLANAEPVPLADVPHLDLEAFRATVIEATKTGSDLAALFGQPAQDGQVRLYGVLARPEAGTLDVLTTAVGAEYPAITPEAPQAHWFEREIAEQWGVVPRGHPWLKPIRFHRSYRKGRGPWARATDAAMFPSVPVFFRVEGEEIHEVPVGPVPAGVIEPGHFRFQC